MTALKPNAELAYPVLDYVRAHPEQNDQGDYIAKLDTEHPPGPTCGTVACYAGWTCILSGDQLALLGGLYVVDLGDGFFIGVHDRAAAHLRLDLSQAYQLFIATQEPDDLPGMVEEIFGPRPDSYGTGCRCDYLGPDTPEHAPSPLCESLRPDAERDGASCQ